MVKHEKPIKNFKALMPDWINDVLNETEKERYERKLNLCSKCKYGLRGIGVNKRSSVLNYTCNYWKMEKHSRNCSPINCKYFDPKEGK